MVVKKQMSKIKELGKKIVKFVKPKDSVDSLRAKFIGDKKAECQQKSGAYKELLKDNSPSSYLALKSEMPDLTKKEYIELSKIERQSEEVKEKKEISNKYKTIKEATKHSWENFNKKIDTSDVKEDFIHNYIDKIRWYRKRWNRFSN